MAASTIYEVPDIVAARDGSSPRQPCLAGDPKIGAHGKLVFSSSQGFLRHAGGARAGATTLVFAAFHAS
jgi:hypothetical protein